MQTTRGLLRDTTPDLVQDNNNKKMKFTSINVENKNSDGMKEYYIQGTDAKGNKFQLKKINDRTVKMTVNEAEIPENNYDQYAQIFEEMENQWNKLSRSESPEVPSMILDMLKKSRAEESQRADFFQPLQLLLWKCLPARNRNFPTCSSAFISCHPIDQKEMIAYRPLF